jgi:hypothetical protein
VPNNTGQDTRRLTKAQCRRAAGLATPAELEQFGNLSLLQQTCIASDDSAGIDQAAGAACALARQILKRDPRPSKAEVT